MALPGHHALEFDAIPIQPGADLHLGFHTAAQFTEGTYTVHPQGEDGIPGGIQAGLMVMVGRPGEPKLSGYLAYSVESGVIRIVHRDRGAISGTFQLWIRRTDSGDRVEVPWAEWPGRHKAILMRGTFQLD